MTEAQERCIKSISKGWFQELGLNEHGEAGTGGCWVWTFGRGLQLAATSRCEGVVP